MAVAVVEVGVDVAEATSRQWSRLEGDARKWEGRREGAEGANEEERREEEGNGKRGQGTHNFESMPGPDAGEASALISTVQGPSHVSSTLNVCLAFAGMRTG